MVTKTFLLDNGTPARAFQADDIGEALLKDLCLLSAKPALYIANVLEEKLLSGNPWVEKLLHRGGKGFNVTVHQQNIFAKSGVSRYICGPENNTIGIIP